MEQQPGQALSNVQAVPTEDERAIRAARTALMFAVAGAILLFGVYLMDARSSVSALISRSGTHCPT